MGLLTSVLFAWGGGGSTRWIKLVHDRIFLPYFNLLTQPRSAVIQRFFSFAQVRNYYIIIMFSNRYCFVSALMLFCISTSVKMLLFRTFPRSRYSTRILQSHGFSKLPRSFGASSAGEILCQHRICIGTVHVVSTPVCIDDS